MSFLGVLKRSKNQSGQALLLVLLSMAIVLTIVLSVSSKSISDVSVGTYEEDALRAFSAAEAGVETALLSNKSFSTPQIINTSDTSVTFTSTIANNPAGSTFVYPEPLHTGETATFWYVGRDSNGQFKCNGTGDCYKGNKISDLCWGSSNITYSNDNEKPAVLLSVYYDTTKSYLTGDFSNIQVVRRAYDPVPARQAENNFGAAQQINNNSCGKDFQFRVRNINYGPDLNIPNACFTGPNAEGCLIMARVKLFYNNATKPDEVGFVVSGNNLPAQGNKIESIGVAGNSTRKINVFQSFPEPPPIFDAAVFSETNLVK